MLEILRAGLVRALLTTLLIFSCSFSNYITAQPVNVHYGWQRTVKLENLSIRVFLAGQDTGAVNYSATLFVGKISNGKNIKLSKLKVMLTDAATGDSAHVFEPVKFSAEVCHKCQQEKDAPVISNTTEMIPAGELADGRDIDLKSGKAYAFAYGFKGLNDQGFPARLTVTVEFELITEGKITTIQKTFDCPRKGRVRFVSL